MTETFKDEVEREVFLSPAGDRGPASDLESFHPTTDMERRLRESEERFEALVRATGQITWTALPDGLVDDVPHWRAFTGQTREEVRGHGWLQAIHPDDRGGAALAWSNAVQNRFQYDAQYRLRRHDGIYRTYVGRGVPVLERDGTVREWVGSCIDVTERETVEAELRRTRDQLALIFEHVADGITVQDPSGALVFANRAAARLIGFASTRELLEADVGDIVSRFVLFDEAGHELSSLELPGRHALQGKQAEERLIRFRQLDTGEDHWALVNATAAFDDAGQVRFAINVFRDITERKQLEERLAGLLAAEQDARMAAEREHKRASDLAVLLESARAGVEAQRARLHHLIMQAPTLIAVGKGPDLVFELANPLYLQMVGDRDIIGKPAREALPALEGQGFFEIAENVYASGEPFMGNEMPVVLKRRDGTIIEHFYNFVMQPTQGDHGQIDGVMVHAVDVTDQIVARRRVEELAAEREATLGQIVDGIHITDPDGTITYLNEAGARILGVSALDVPIDQHADVYHAFYPDGTPYRSEDLPLSRAVLHGEKVVDVDVLIRRPDGKQVVVEVNATPITSPLGHRLGAVATFRDVTAQRAVERQKDEFLSAAAHDLKTPVTTIKGLAQLLRRRALRLPSAEAASISDGLERIDAGASRLTAQINQLLDLTRMQMGRALDLDWQHVDLISLVRRVIAEQKRVLPKHRVVLRTDTNSLRVRLDALRMERVIVNLLSNAAKYSPAGGEILVTIVLEDDGSRVVLSVSDKGIGIPADDIPFVFDRFYRGRNAGSNFQGTGIGLSSVRQIVDQHRGNISIESKEGRGTTVTLTLPIEDTSAPA